MSINVIAVFILIVCRVRVQAISNDEDPYNRKPSRYTYNDLSNENTLLDTSHQEYYQETTQNPVKVDRDDSTYTGGKGTIFTLQSRDGLGSSSNIGNVNFDSYSNTFSLGGSVDGMNLYNGLNSAPSGGSASNSAYTYSGGGPSFTPSISSSAFGHGGGSGTPSFGNTFYSGGGGGYIGGGYGGSSDGGYSNLQPVIHKSVYVHIAPPEEEVPRQKVIVPRIPPKKNYQIVFIKAPTPPPPSVPVIPPFPPQSDKTLIYVLHPKPEEAPPIHIPAPPQNVPVKPEVYFIRYKTRKDEIPNDGGGYHRRYGRDGEETNEESLDATDTESKILPAEVRESDNQYEEQNDSSGESSNIVNVGKNAH